MLFIAHSSSVCKHIRGKQPAGKIPSSVVYSRRRKSEEKYHVEKIINTLSGCLRVQAGISDSSRPSGKNAERKARLVLNPDCGKFRWTTARHGESRPFPRYFNHVTSLRLHLSLASVRLNRNLDRCSSSRSNEVSTSAFAEPFRSLFRIRFLKIRRMEARGR